MQDFDTGPRFHSPADLGRLNNSYFLYDGKPIQLTVHGDMTYKADIVEPGQKVKLKTIDTLNDPLLSLSSPELGFMNSSDGDVRYVFRRPNRQWHYLFEGNCAYYSLLNHRTIGCQQPQFFCQQFADMILGKYPSYRDIMSACKDKPFFHAKAFDRYFAIRYQSEEYGLFYRDELIAKYNPQEDVWNLEIKFDFPTLINHLENHGLSFGV